MIYLEIAAILVLIVINGFLAMSELAIVSARPARLKAMIERGVKGARTALVLGSDPGRFLSTVQIGITLVGVLSGAFSGATLGIRLTATLEASGMQAGLAGALGVGLVVALITYASLIVGELVPKQLALRKPEGIAARVAPPMRVLAAVAAPVVWLLDNSGRAVLWLIGHREERAQTVTDEEIKMLVAEAEHHGTIESDERKMIAGVMRLGDRAVRAVMTPRTEVDWIDLKADDASTRKLLVNTQHSRLPVADGSIDAMVGVIQAREILAAMLAGKSFDPGKHVRPAPIVHDQADALDVLTTLKTAEVPLALVHDEYGNFEGVVAPADILEAIAGVFRADLAEDEIQHAMRRDDGSWLLAGHMPADEMADQLGIALPGHRDYQTVAGYLLSHFHHLPAVGESVDADGWRFEVMNIDGRRIDRVWARRMKATHRRAAR